MILFKSQYNIYIESYFKTPCNALHALNIVNFPVLYQSLERDFFPEAYTRNKKEITPLTSNTSCQYLPRRTIIALWLIGIIPLIQFSQTFYNQISAQIENDGIVSSFLIGCQRNTGLWLVEKSMSWALIDRDIIGRNKMGHNWAWKLLHFVQLLIGSFVVKTLLWPLLN